MCGRFTLRTPADEIAATFAVQLPIEFTSHPYQPRFNIAPAQNISVVVEDPSQSPSRQWRFFRWGLVPAWAKDLSVGYRMINARGETVADKPSFRTAFRKRRCLVIADGFYEWRKTDSGKQPFHFRREDDGLFAFAGLWEKWSGDQTVYSCTIITTDANSLLKDYHDRMPVILDPADYQLWLDPQWQKPEPLQQLLRPYPAEEMTVREANPIVNHVKNETPECLQP